MTSTRWAACCTSSSPATPRSRPTPRSPSSTSIWTPPRCRPRQLGAELPPAFENYLLGLLAKQPEHRPAAAQVSEWFTAGAWQGRPEPLPATAPAPAAPAASQPARTDGTGPATTYMLPSGPRAAARRRPRTGARSALVRPGVAGTAAAVTLFLAAMVAGMLWFAPDDMAAEGSENSPGATPAVTGTATPPPSGPAASASPAGSATPAARTSPTPVAAYTGEKAQDGEKAQEEKPERRRQGGDEGDDGDDGDD
ncbi:hypothetical protein GCM10020295_71470 [Streptomyces cinereospinus]